MKKVETIRKYRRPEDEEGVRRFLGLINYYRKFMLNFSTIAEPLTQFIRKNTPFRWEETQQKVFEQLKEELANSPILKQPDFTEPFILETMSVMWE